MIENIICRIHERDNVAVALREIEEGETVRFGELFISAKNTIPQGHKVALMDMDAHTPVIKYGNVIGLTATKIPAGGWLHDHNIISQGDNHNRYTYQPDLEAIFPGTSDDTFMGYQRPNGEVGTRNYIILISGSFCTNTHLIDFAKMAADLYPQTENFDGFLPLTHECGCGQMGDDLKKVRQVLGALISNANFGGVLFVELGCENNQYDTIKPFVKADNPERFFKICMQQSTDEYQEAMEKLGILYERVNQDRRTPCPISKLHIAENCGGSDGFSGITGNRLVGKLTEHLIGTYGSTVNITEVPEMFGAEHILMNRAKDETTFYKVVHLIESFKKYIEKYGASASGNPSFGNRQGGISTIEDKSLGCIQKGGHCAVMDVISYGDHVTEPGLNLVWGPGSDLVGVTAQIAAGATLVVFITGRGTPVAYAAPTFKIATNTAIYEKKKEWMDFNAGSLLSGDSLERMEQELFEQIIALAEGRYSASNERVGFYQIALLRDGVTL